jgi:UPF0271 protein
MGGKTINLNADMGEGFGAYDIGDDAGLLKIIRSASIACGFHAGDPVTMQRLVTQAVADGVSIGAHPGFNDLWGFGRRRIDMKTVDRDIIYVALAGSEMEKAGRELELPVAREGFCDRLYDDDGNLTSRKVPGAVLHDPEVVRERVVDMVLNEEIVSRNGKALRLRLDTLCVHGDEPSGVIVARAARQGLEAAGVRVVPLPEMTLGGG